MRLLSKLVLCLGAAVTALAAAPCRADLVVFDDGRVVKAATYRVVDEQELEIGVPGGGSYRVDLNRVERIVEDEIVELCDQFDPSLPTLAQNYDLSYREDRKPLFNTAFDKLIAEESRRYGVDASMVSALIRAESNYEPRAVSRKGARGLMQLMPATAHRLSLSQPFDPVANVRAGVRYLKELMDRFDHRPELVLAAYNAGENAVENYGGVPPYRETQSYVKRILSWWTPAIAASPKGAAPIVKASS
ncbi:MAG TPA: lytic transglycosylase domain-containing protein [Thermoanaerobaculia bacterium]|nr:lytic transglycosylase domain-containing protein [Thermoanaerobaculia bacterium]